MINNNSNFNTFLYGEKFPIEKWEEDVVINFWIKQTYKSIKCPKCGHICTSVHESHNRVIQDTPIHNKCVYINICVREFKCENDDCQVKTFTEQLPFTGKNQVRVNSKIKVTNYGVIIRLHFFIFSFSYTICFIN